MKNKVVIGIILLCLIGVILFLTFGDNTENNLGDIVGITDNTTYELSYNMSVKTFYITGPKGYKYNEDRTGTWNSKAIFEKENKIYTSLTYSFEYSEMDEYFKSIKFVHYENRLDSEYYKNLTWQDTKTLTVNDNEITYVKVTHNDGSTYWNEIFSMATVNGWRISCEITQYGDSNSFDSESKLLKDAWEISFTEED